MKHPKHMSTTHTTQNQTDRHHHHQCRNYRVFIIHRPYVGVTQQMPRMHMHGEDFHRVNLYHRCIYSHT